jgi:outer membrane protein
MVMKNTNYIISGILAIAIIILFILQCTGRKCENKDAEALSGDSLSVQLPLAYVNADSLLTQFNFYTRLIGDYENKLSKQHNVLNQKAQNFQNEVVEFQQKAQNNAFLTRERYEQEQTRLARKQNDLEQEAARADQELALELKIIQQQISDTLSVAMKEFNKPQKYQLIFTRSGNNNILYATESYDITREVIGFLNMRYKVEK